MSKTSEKVEPLKKVTLTVTAGENAPSGDGGGDTAAVEFVYGVGPDGLTPFEYALADAAVGDTITLSVEKGQYAHTLGHIRMILPEPLPRNAVVLKVHVDHVEPAGQREVIRAMAEASSCKDTCCGQ